MKSDCTARVVIKRFFNSVGATLVYHSVHFSSANDLTSFTECKLKTIIELRNCTYITLKAAIRFNLRIPSKLAFEKCK